MGLGFELEESFSGSYYLLSDQLNDRAIRLTVRWKVDGIRRFLRERKISAVGTVYIEGLAERDPNGVHLEGSVVMKLFDEKRIPYDLRFEADDGTRWRLRGQRDFFVHDAMDSLTILPVSLYGDDNVEAGRAVLRFDPKSELVTTVKSFRPRLRVMRLSEG